MKNLLTIIALLVVVSAYGQQTDEQNRALSNHPDSVIFTMVPKMPSFGSNKEDLQNFINKESKIKTSKTRTSTSMNVFVNIVIEKDGSVTFDKIARGVDKKHDKEAKRIAENMPNWSSGYLENGDKVRVVMMFPIWFVK